MELIDTKIFALDKRKFEVKVKMIDNYPSFLSLCEIAKAVDNDFNADNYFNRSYFFLTS